MSLSRPIQWYHSHADLIRPDSKFVNFFLPVVEGTVYIFGGIQFRGFIDRTDITLIPTINPDGFDRATEGRCVGKATFL